MMTPNIVIDYAAPGLKDHLLNTINNAEDYIKDADIPEEVTVTADVKDFSMNMTLTVASSDMGDMNLKDTLVCQMFRNRWTITGGSK